MACNQRGFDTALAQPLRAQAKLLFRKAPVTMGTPGRFGGIRRWSIIRHTSARALRFGCYRLMRSTASHLRSFTVIVNLISHWMTSGIPFLRRVPAPPWLRVAG